MARHTLSLAEAWRRRAEYSGRVDRDPDAPLDRQIGAVAYTELPSYRDARRAIRSHRTAHGFADGVPALLTPPEAQPKAAKNSTPTYVLHLAPHKSAGVGNLCPWATAGCIAVCLNTAGRGQYDSVQLGRLWRTWLLSDLTTVFLAKLVHEVAAAIAKHGRIGLRLNGTSDARWESLAAFLLSIFGDAVVFYDYTKAPRRAVPEHYHLTYSVNERNTPEDVRKMADRYGRVAVVVDTPAPVGGAPKLPLPCSWGGLDAVDGDVTDWRLETGPVAVLLRAKGEAKTDTSGFVRPTVAA